jgi:hypothetical protein
VVRLQPLFALACAVLSLTVALLIGAGLAESLVYAVLVAAGGIRQFLRVAGCEGRQAASWVPTCSTRPACLG